MQIKTIDTDYKITTDSGGTPKTVNIPDLKNTMNRRALAGGVWFDGVSGLTETSKDIALGTDDFTFVVETNFDELPATNTMLLGPTMSGGINVDYSSNGVRVYASGGGTVLTSTTLFDSKKSKYVFLKRKSGTVTLLQGDSVVLTGTLTDDLISSAYILGQRNANPIGYFKGTLRDFAAFNLALTATQAAEIATERVGPWLARHPELRWVDNATLNTSAFTDPQSGATGETATAFSVGSTSDTVAILSAPSFSVVAGEKYGVTFDIANVAGFSSSNPVRIRLNNTNSGFGTSINSVSNLVQYESNLADGTYSLEFIADESESNAYLMFAFMNGGQTADFTNIKLVKLGALAHLPMTDGIGRQLRDNSINRNDALLSETGFAHLVQKPDGQISRINQDLSTDGNWIDASDILPANALITDIVIDGRRLDVLDTVDQDLTARRIYIASATNTLTFSRTNDGTAGTTLASGDVTDETNTSILIKYTTL